MESEQQTHLTRRAIRPNGDIEINCSCGALWTHPEGTTDEKMESIRLSHISYFDRPAMKTL